jgi:glutathione synthase/RimK-type ligase-like ATP-grasp enzyme
VVARSRPWFREHGAIVQELIDPRGHDLRVVVAGGRVVGSAARVSLPGEWRTNAALGANVIPAIAPPLAQALAVAAVDAVGADLAGVDLLPTRNGWVILEVNGAVDFRPLYAWGRDVYADAIAAVLDAAERRRPALAAV